MANDICARAVHPGELLKEEVEFRNISQRTLSKNMGMSYNMLNDILNGRRTLTTQSAMLFEAALGISAELLMRLQLDYNLQTAKQDRSLAQRLASIKKLQQLCDIIITANINRRLPVYGRKPSICLRGR